MKSYFIFTIILFSSLGYSWMSDYVSVRGVVKSFDEKEVVLEDDIKGQIIVPRDLLPTNYKLVSGQYASIPVKAGNFLAIRSAPSPQIRRLKMSANDAMINLKIGIKDFKKRTR